MREVRAGTWFGFAQDSGLCRHDLNYNVSQMISCSSAPATAARYPPGDITASKINSDGIYLPLPPSKFYNECDKQDRKWD